MRLRLGASKTGLSPPVILYYCSFQGDTSVVVPFVLYFGFEFYDVVPMYVLIFYLSSGNWMTAYWEIAAHSAYDMFSKYKYLIAN